MIFKYNQFIKESKQEIDSICKEYKFHITSYEEVSSEKVSTLLASLDFGLTTTIYSKIDKSGSVAAMIEHGLSVISLAEQTNNDQTSKIKAYLNEKYRSIYEYKKGELEQFILSDRRIQGFDDLNNVSNKLLSYFNM